MNRRTRNRIDLQLTCRVGAGAVLSQAVGGVIENASRDGLLMRWLAAVPLPEIGTALEVDVELPSDSGFPPRLMHFKTSVVRIVDAETDQPSVGLEILNMRFIADTARELHSLPTPNKRIV